MGYPSALLRTPAPNLEPLWQMRAASEPDMRWLAPRLTRASLREMEALSKFQPISTLLKDMDRKMVIVDSRNPSQPVAVLEAVPVAGTTGATYWSAITEKVVGSDAYWDFTLYANTILTGFTRQYSSLSTYVDVCNVQHINWLERIGFRHVEDVPQHGYKGLPFKLYRRSSSNV